MPRIRMQSTKGDEIIAEWTTGDHNSFAIAKDVFDRLVDQGCIPFNLGSQDRIGTLDPEPEADVLFIRPIKGGV